MGVADVYAAALFELARERDKIGTIRAELEELAKLRGLVPDAGAVFTSPALDDERRTEILEKVFRGRMSDELVNTLHVMNQRGRHGLIESLLACYVRRQEEAAGQVEATATAAVEFSAEQRTEIERVAAERSGKSPLVKFVVDPEILGGLILQIGDLRFDNSVRSQLQAARRKLLERAERGLSA
jgi:F-type H+-transporting ATPase subunit delta